MQSTISKFHLLVSSRSHPLRPDLVDGIIDAIVTAPDQPARSQVKAELIGEIHESVTRLYTDPDGRQLISLRHVTTEFAAHLHRLSLTAAFKPGPEAMRSMQLLAAVTTKRVEQQPPRTQSNVPAGDC